MLGPRHAATSETAEADAVRDTGSGVDGGAEAELPDVVTPQNLGRMWASSMGLSFAVPAAVDALAVAIEWGSYGKRQTTTEDAATRSVWFRGPVRHEREVRVDGEPSVRLPLSGDDPAAPGVLLAVDVRPRDGQRIVRLVLVNAQQEPQSNADTAWLFQSRLTVTALDGDAAVFVPIDDPADCAEGPDRGIEDGEELHLRLLYRAHRRYAAGHNVAVLPHVRAEPVGAGSRHPDNDDRRAWKLETTWVPAHDVPAMVAAGSAGDAQLSMDTLAEAGAEELAAGLAPLADGYAAWLDQQDRAVPGLPDALRPTGAHAVETARAAAARVRAGIALLSTPAAPGHADALAAFRFANRAMALQRRHTALTRLRADTDLDYPDALARVAAPEHAMWRPFQLAFVLLNLPALADPGHPERAADETATVDLLFFPTGGGKTEAYLGLTAFTLAIRRRQGVVGSGAEARSGADGVAVLMR
ncbi:MAG: hypothetical protein L0H84_22980 [Pseudonocardia sp.]|nr:hypothetical protein [Pseudonocardia sp.]